MEELTNNSNKAKEESIPLPVLKSEAKPVKKSGGRKFIELFVKETPEDVGRYIVRNVVIPNLQNMAHAALDRGIYALFYGIKDTPPAKTLNGIPERSSIMTEWKGGSASSTIPPSLREQNREYKIREYDLESRGDAEYVMTMMENVVNGTGKVSIGYYYSLISKEAEKTDWNYGWTNLDTMKAKANSNGRWEIIFPPIKCIVR